MLLTVHWFGPSGAVAVVAGGGEGRLSCGEIQLVGEAGGAGSEVDYAAVGEAVAGDAVLHYAVVAVRVDADVGVLGEAPVHNDLEDAVDVRVAANTVHHVIRGIVQPGPAFDVAVCRLRGWYKGEIRNDHSVLLGNEAGGVSDVGQDDIFRWITVHPLPGVPGCAHNALGRVQHDHNCLKVFGNSASDSHQSLPILQLQR